MNEQERNLLMAIARAVRQTTYERGDLNKAILNKAITALEDRTKREAAQSIIMADFYRKRIQGFMRT